MTKGPNDFMNGNSGRLCSNNYLLRYSFYIYAKKKKALNVRSQLKNQQLGEKVYTEVLMSFGEGNSNPLLYSCLEKSHRQRSLAGHSPCGRRESDTTEATEHARSYVIIFFLHIIKYFYQMIIWRKSDLRYKS